MSPIRTAYKCLRYGVARRHPSLGRIAATWRFGAGPVAGLLLAGLGAQIIKVQPTGENPTRRIGPFLGDDPDPETSLFFRGYNRGKHSVVLHLEGERDMERLFELIDGADIFLNAAAETRSRVERPHWEAPPNRDRRLLHCSLPGGAAHSGIAFELHAGRVQRVANEFDSLGPERGDHPFQRS